LPIARTRVFAVALIGLGTLCLAPIVLWLTQPPPGAHVTIVGAALNMAPGAFMLTSGATLLARPTSTVVAFWLAPLWAPLLTWAWVSIYGNAPYPAVVAIPVALFAYLVLLFVGFPTFAYLRGRKLNGLVVTAIAGSVVAACTTWLARVLIAFSTNPGDVDWWAFQVAADLFALSTSALLGGLSAATFWAVVRPDRL
jgi:hypothetical protein